MPLKRSQAVPFVAKEVCRRPYTFESESVGESALFLMRFSENKREKFAQWRSAPTLDRSEP
jgi:hypothetical protein